MEQLAKVFDNKILFIDVADIGVNIKKDYHIDTNFNSTKIEEINEYPDMLLHNVDGTLIIENKNLHDRLLEIQFNGLYFDESVLQTYTMIKEFNPNYYRDDIEQFLSERKEEKEIRSKIDYYYILENRNKD